MKFFQHKVQEYTLMYINQYNDMLKIFERVTRHKKTKTYKSSPKCFIT